MNEAYLKTVASQRGAANPNVSAFVSANAGSGKTRVLTNRVARLLLKGTPPQKIVCITFTKAAATEMAERLFKLLGEWTLADDDALRGKLNELEGTLAHRDTEELRQARRLFARALETPGGLKIQTIHAFCESVLRRFPVESGVPPGFSVIEDVESGRLLNGAIDTTALKSRADPALASAFSRLGEAKHGSNLKETVFGELKRPGSLFRNLSLAEIEQRVGNALSCDERATEQSVKRAAVDEMGTETLRGFAEMLSYGGSTSSKKGVAIKSALELGGAGEQFDALAKAMLKSGTMTRYDSITDGSVRKAFPEANGLEIRIVDVLVTALEQVKRLGLYADTMAAARVLKAAEGEYKRAKTARAALDFDDLIAGAQSLFANVSKTAWALYKLDEGIDHILLDEAQDTNPDAWKVIEGPLEEFMAGSGARDTERTFFAVGDQKQSIYSFQGADSALFAEKEANLGKSFPPGKYAQFPLHLSFRTTAPVLAFVDKLFAQRAVLDGVGNEFPLTHHVFREGHGGRVELWPLTPAPDKVETEPWDLPLNAITSASPKAQLANEVAKTIRDWLDKGTILPSQGRSVRPSDVMILVQSRSDLYHEMIRALSTFNIPAAGADKIKMLEDQTVLDLLSAARAALLRDDNLSLAESLKSPIHGFTEEDLYDLAYSRRGSLREALANRASERAVWSEAHARLTRFEEVARNEGPVNFFNYVLDTGKPTGRKRQLARLGGSIDEPLNEFIHQAMTFEQSNARSLRGFVSWFVRNASEVNRNPEQSGNTVRVMTVHKSKGLESPIVFLLDGQRMPRLASTYFELASDKGDAPVLNFRAANRPEIMTNALQEARDASFAEFRRLLYVAATRAEDWLFVCGVESAKTKKINDKPIAERHWHALAQKAFIALGDEVEEIGEKWGKPVRAFISQQTVEPKPHEESASRASANLPEWIDKAVPPESVSLVLSPSRLADKIEWDGSADEETKEDAAFSPGRGTAAHIRGTALHRALELLPGLDPSKRAYAAPILMKRIAPMASDAEIDVWQAEVSAVLDDPRFAQVFGPGSRAEVTIGGRLDGDLQGPIIYGQIDRLVILDDRILVVDYKTNRPPPKTAEAVPLAYLAQMGAYAALLKHIHGDRPVEAALLWTYEARLTYLPEELIMKALKSTLA